MNISLICSSYYHQTTMIIINFIGA